MVSRRAGQVCKLFAEAEGGFASSSQGTPYFYAVCSGAVAVHFLVFYLLASYSGYLLAVLAGLTLQAFHGIGHNALHKADNMWMYCYDWCGWKHHHHRVSHALSHHLHPNTPLDLEHPEPHSFVFTDNAHRNSRWVLLHGPWSMYTGPLKDIFNLWHGKER